jgi:hypothetical protein
VSLEEFEIQIEIQTEITILRTFFEAEAETRIPPLVFASVMMLKPAFHHWRFKIVRTVEITNDIKIQSKIPDRNL